MRGGSLTRFRPDDQSGGALLGDIASASLRSGWEGLKTGTPWGLPLNIKGGIRGVKRGGRRAIKRKALEEINKRAKRKLTDIFGE